VLNHLRKWRNELSNRWDRGDEWWELRPCDYYDAIERPKIVYPDIARDPRFAFDEGRFYVLNTIYFIASRELYLLGLLNSPLMWELAKQKLSVLGDADKGGRLRFFRQFVLSLPIPEAPLAERAAIAALVQECLDAKGIGCEKWEEEINERVAALYGL
jgi:hypothetical protein